MIKILLLFSVAVWLCHSAPLLKDDAGAKILRYENTNDGSGNYFYSYETSNGISREEKGTLVNGGLPNAYTVVEGTVSYTDPDGKVTFVKYTADENGYHVFPEEDDTSFMFPQVEVVQAVPPAVLATLLG